MIHFHNSHFATTEMAADTRVKWNKEPRGLIWQGVVTEVSGDQVRVHWDGKWAAGPWMSASDLTAYEVA